MSRDDPIPIDAGRGGDWIKQGQWDLDGVDDLPSLRAWLDGVGMSAAAFKRLPVYRANVSRRPWLRDL